MHRWLLLIPASLYLAHISLGIYTRCSSYLLSHELQNRTCEMGTALGIESMILRLYSVLKSSQHYTEDSYLGSIGVWLDAVIPE